MEESFEEYLKSHFDIDVPTHLPSSIVELDIELEDLFDD